MVSKGETVMENANPEITPPEKRIPTDRDQCESSLTNKRKATDVDFMQDSIPENKRPTKAPTSLDVQSVACPGPESVNPAVPSPPTDSVPKENSESTPTESADSSLMQEVIDQFNEEDGPTYEVEAVRLSRYSRKWREFEYLIKWKGYPESENSWEPESNLHPVLAAEQQRLRREKEEAARQAKLEKQLEKERKRLAREKRARAREQAEAERAASLSSRQIAKKGRGNKFTVGLNDVTEILGCRKASDGSVEMAVVTKHGPQRYWVSSGLLVERLPKLVLDYYQARISFGPRVSQALQVGPAVEADKDKGAPFVVEL
ncbi:Chromo (CHRromatin Organization MOdifier) domain [Carpediemonas membranifera]|uniref:Chromo (CHRromatin Organization MOdifier) domain n=1 Tax=Carpediemonas membranifera TaxID=201153 RepID=A0A8J6AW14_9EUKA|nr:Chromo (CHRromatin Organization MOdifier) domain [Carpediemonas membranifera]|eukprot:KAG9392970.1 Chromo (CHRromatin Organization MOdifier) domain [Carpediemonas membranifera]